MIILQHNSSYAGHAFETILKNSIDAITSKIQYSHIRTIVKVGVMKLNMILAQIDFSNSKSANGILSGTFARFSSLHSTENPVFVEFVHWHLSGQAVELTKCIE